jgi:hypothetical protein
MADFLKLQHIAILGINNHDGELPVAPDVADIYRGREHDNPALCFLDLASLSHAYHHFSSLPAAGASFDELPPLAPETLPTVSRPLAENTVWHLSSQTLPGFALLLFRAGKVLPESWLLPALKLAAADNSLRLLVQLTLSAKARWLGELNPEWRGLALDEQPGRWPLALQLRHLQTLEPGTALDWIIAHWTQAPPDQRAQWLSVLHDLPAADLAALAPLLNGERSAKTRRPLRRLLAMKGVDDTAARATELLAHYLSRSAGLMRAKLTVQPPETLTPELADLGIDDQDHLHSNRVKPALRLGQLLVLAGVDGIAVCLDQSVEDSYASLADSKFKHELAPFLLEAALWSRSHAALSAWCRHFNKEKSHSFSLANALVGIDKRCAGRLLAELTGQSMTLWVDGEVYNWLIRHDLGLDSACSRFVCDAEIQRNNCAALMRLAALLAGDVVQELAISLDNSDSNARLLPEFLTVLRFRIALENDK